MKSNDPLTLDQLSLPVYILAGGASRRFGSDKALAELDGVPLIRRVATALASVSLRTTVVADRADKYEPLGLHTIADERLGLGPLAGLEAALADRLTCHGRGWLVLTSCDQISPTADEIKQLAAVRSERDASAVAFRSAHWEPMPGLYHTSIAPTVTELLDTDRRSMQQLLDGVDAMSLPLPSGAGRLRQVNTQAQLAEFTRDGGLG